VQNISPRQAANKVSSAESIWC